MNVQGVVDRVLKKFGDEANTQINTSDIISWINDGQKEIAIQNDVNQAIGTRDIQALIGEYPIPGDMLALRTIYCNSSRLSYMELSEYDEYIRKSDPLREIRGTPTIYTRWASSIIVYPIPDVGIGSGLILYYIARPADVVSVDNELSLSLEYHTRIVEYCMQQAYETDEDWEGAAFKKAQFQEGVDRLRGQEQRGVIEYYSTITVLPEDE